MLYATFNIDNTFTGMTAEAPVAHRCARNESRWDWTLERAQQIAAMATELHGDTYVATDAGPYCSPRYDVVRVPAVGDMVSYSFNGDTYPDGTIVKVSPSLQVTTSNGTKYFRRRQTGSWVKQGGTWSLVSGHRNERNPHF